jgi:hypothetical protein
MANLYINDTPGVTRIAPPVQARYACSTGQALTANVTPINFDTKDIDTDNAVTTGAGWKFTCPTGKSGTYTVVGSFAPGSAASCYLYKNGIQQKILATFGAAGQAAFAVTIDLLANDYIDVRSGSSISLQSGVVLNWICILRVPDTNVSAGQSVATVSAQYNTSTAQVITTGNIINYSTVEWDSHSAVTTGASWKFTCPAGQAGYYKVYACLYANASINVELWKNGVLFKTIGTALTTINGTGSATVFLNAGDYIDIRVTGSGTLAVGATSNYINITKVQDQATAPVIQGYTAVKADYGANGAQTISGGGQVNFDTKSIDTDSAVTTGVGTWKFTCPVGKGGVYLVCGCVVFTSTQTVILYKNNAVIRALTTTGGNSYAGSFATAVELQPGDFIDVRNPGNGTTVAGVVNNFIQIESLSASTDSRIDTGWIAATLTNSWQNYPGYQVKYRKINGIVYVQGVLNVAGGQGVTTTSAFTLPVGFRPAQSTNKAAVASSYWLTSANYQPDGTVPCNFENVAAAYLDVSHCFPADG